jgi:hypothetical protein
MTDRPRHREIAPLILPVANVSPNRSQNGRSGFSRQFSWRGSLANSRQGAMGSAALVGQRAHGVELASS